ncbi:MAG: S1 RNA-binding domain-containing protein [Candidatus Parcubacteria bacterium]|nr:S1 RNA-binding domain-containing protein [Candidatus Parcubacteria bacterium]
MEKYVEKMPKLPEEGDVIEGRVIGIEKTELYIDLAPLGTGIIYGREFMNARDIIRKLNIGDIVTAKVLERENEEGYIELSLKEAHQAIVWNEAEDLLKNKTVIKVPVKEANKGGLIIDWKGLQGFLPASQLGAEHYPRVEDGDKVKIMEELKKLVGQKIAVTILMAVPKEGKLIFTEKANDQKEREVIVEKYTVGNEVEGEITGIVDFGIFVKIEDGLEGLVHISELDWGLVEDPRKMFKVGEKIHAKIIEINNGKISLSIKALKANPWINAKDRYKKGDDVKGVIIKYNKYGALASIEEGVAGLIHMSEFGTEEKLKEALELGKTYTFKITHFDPKDQKMALSYKVAPAK